MVNMRIAGVESTDLFAGSDAAPLQVVRVTVETTAPAEAGAVVGDSKGGPPSPSMTVAAGPGLFGPLRDALAELDAERDG